MSGMSDGISPEDLLIVRFQGFQNYISTSVQVTLDMSSERGARAEVTVIITIASRLFPKLIDIDGKIDLGNAV